MKVSKENLLAICIEAQTFYNVFCFLKSDFDKNKMHVSENCPIAMIVNGTFALELYLKLYYAMLKCDPDVEIGYTNDRNIVQCKVYKLGSMPSIPLDNFRIESIKCNGSSQNCMVEVCSGHDLKKIYDLCIVQDSKELLIKYIFHGKRKGDIESGLDELKDKFVQARYFFEANFDELKFERLEILEFMLEQLKNFFEKVHFNGKPIKIITSKEVRD